MKTKHKIIFRNSQCMEGVPDKSIALVVTSCPYPLIEIWDEMFVKQNPEIENALLTKKGPQVFELMHKELDVVWSEIFRVLIEGGIACINIGDATRKLGLDFQLYPNHSRVLNYCLKIGFQILPGILWRKPTNAPNKFMGSGMLPPGAYVTLEHEHILILRKNGIRKFLSSDQKERRRESAYFWEERNKWFSDIWMDLRGISQNIDSTSDDLRKRSAAYPFELAFRLINMFSIKGDIVLDPFLGTGTTILAAMASERNSIGFEINPNLKDIIFQNIQNISNFSNEHRIQRINAHLTFIAKRTENKKNIGYRNEYHKFPVMTKQEEKLVLNEVTSCQRKDDFEFEVTYG